MHACQMYIYLTSYLVLSFLLNILYIQMYWTWCSTSVFLHLHKHIHFYTYTFMLAPREKQSHRRRQTQTDILKDRDRDLLHLHMLKVTFFLLSFQDEQQRIRRTVIGRLVDDVCWIPCGRDAVVELQRELKRWLLQVSCFLYLYKSSSDGQNLRVDTRWQEGGLSKGVVDNWSFTDSVWWTAGWYAPSVSGYWLLNAVNCVPLISCSWINVQYTHMQPNHTDTQAHTHTRTHTLTNMQPHTYTVGLLTNTLTHATHSHTMTLIKPRYSAALGLELRSACVRSPTWRGAIQMSAMNEWLNTTGRSASGLLYKCLIMITITTHFINIHSTYKVKYRLGH